MEPGSFPTLNICGIQGLAPQCLLRDFFVAVYCNFCLWPTCRQGMTTVTTSRTVTSLRSADGSITQVSLSRSHPMLIWVPGRWPEGLTFTSPSFSVLQFCSLCSGHLGNWEASSSFRPLYTEQCIKGRMRYCQSTVAIRALRAVQGVPVSKGAWRQLPRIKLMPPSHQDSPYPRTEHSR